MNNDGMNIRVQVLCGHISASKNCKKKKLNELDKYFISIKHYINRKYLGIFIYMFYVFLLCSSVQL